MQPSLQALLHQDVDPVQGPVNRHRDKEDLDEDKDKLHSQSNPLLALPLLPQHLVNAALQPQPLDLLILTGSVQRLHLLDDQLLLRCLPLSPSLRPG